MRRTISLDGDWERRDFLDEAWRWSDALRGASGMPPADGPPLKAGISAGWRPAQVPGSALADAWRGGEIANPYVDRNSLAAEWIPERTWLYRRRVGVPAGPAARAALRFEGIDPGGIVFLDGEEVARHRGMFVPLEIDLAGRLRPGGQHDLVVVVDRAPAMPSQVSRTELAREHRSRMGYGWDFCPRMIHTGIWRSVSLELYEARISRPRVAAALSPDRRRARVTIACPVDGDAAGMRLTVRILDPTDAVVAQETVAVVGGRASIALEIRDPAPWWPNGLGAPSLYRAELELSSSEPLDARSVRFGVRSVEAAPTAGASPSARPYTLVVNGRRTWIRGWNWVPIDAAYGVPHGERMRHLVELARRANVNLLRVWGGGLIESDAFYDACDEAGIMVWQEFAQSSSGVGNAPADDAAFLELMRREAEAIAPLRANHPSLVIWCGGNELADGEGRPLDDGHPVLAALHEVVARDDPTRIWLPTSPSGPRFDNSLRAVEADPRSLHDVHGPWEHQGLAAQHRLANATTSLLHSEFGVEGMANPETLAATVSEPHRWPADRSNPVMAHRGAWWNNEPFVQRAFGGGLEPDALARASQHLQADGLRTLIEGDRRRWPCNAGAIPWQLNEPFPNAWCTAAVDAFGIPKAAYHAVAAAYAPLSVGLQLDSVALDGGDLVLTPWVANDTDAALDGTVRIALRDAAGRMLDEASLPLAVAPNSVAQARELTLRLPPRMDDASDLLVLDAGFGTAATRRLLSRTADLGPMPRLGATRCNATLEDAGAVRWLVRLSLSHAPAALELRLADARPVGWPERRGHAYLQENFVTLLPGEERLIGVDWRDVPLSDRALRLSGWNVEASVLRA